MIFCNKYSNMSSYKHLLTLMTGGELSFRICPVCESYAASITIHQRIGRRIMRNKACFIELLSIGL